MTYTVPDNLLDLTRELIALRKKPGTEERVRAYPLLMQRFNEQLEACDDPLVLKQILTLDSGYFLLAGYRQRVIEKLLEYERSADLVRAYAAVKGRVVNVHLSDLLRGRLIPDWKPLYTFFRHHQMPGQGVLPLAEFVRSLVASGFSGHLTLEVSPVALKAWSP